VAFLVTNLGETPISSVIVGAGNDHGFLASDLNVATATEAPEGWTGRVVQGDESPYMYYLWRASKPGGYIAPGRSAAGFRLTLPRDPGRKPQQFLGKEVKQLDFRGLPFRVTTARSSCYWGVVGLDPLPK
jgi:hypothetical protein